MGWFSSSSSIVSAFSSSPNEPETKYPSLAVVADAEIAIAEVAPLQSQVPAFLQAVKVVDAVCQSLNLKLGDMGVAELGAKAMQANDKNINPVVYDTCDEYINRIKNIKATHVADDEEAVLAGLTIRYWQLRNKSGYNGSLICRIINDAFEIADAATDEQEAKKRLSAFADNGAKSYTKR